ncbi:MAG TPA: tetraacyldisaccharide 4'-kinase [Tepidisphaeraceae bacterium]
MADDLVSFHERVMSGSDRSLAVQALRGALAAVEPFYAGVMRARNFAYDRGIKRTHALPRPAVAVGNLTTGGTGKTPVVRWLAEQFANHRLLPAILMRGYRSTETAGSDEQRMLAQHLQNRALVIANPDRLASAHLAMHNDPQPDVFVLDDAFQHRRVRRDFNLLLISATNPFGFGHVLPRGLLREPLKEMARADAILITRQDQVAPSEISHLKFQIRSYTSAPIYQSAHVITHLVSNQRTATLAELSSESLYLFSGIANPSSFFANFPSRVGTMPFPDHHAYSAQDLAKVREDAAKLGASLLVTTEKDFAKLASLPNVNEGLPIYRAQLQIRFEADDAQKLWTQIVTTLPGLASLAASPVAEAPASATSAQRAQP